MGPPPLPDSPSPGVDGLGRHHLHLAHLHLHLGGWGTDDISLPSAPNRPPHLLPLERAIHGRLGPRGEARDGPPIPPAQLRVFLRKGLLPHYPFGSPTESIMTTLFLSLPPTDRAMMVEPIIRRAGDWFQFLLQSREWTSQGSIVIKRTYPNIEPVN